MVNKWIDDNYSNILEWAQKAAQQHKDYEDLAHYAILTFIENPRAAELVESGGARWFIVRILLNSSRGKKSEYYRTYRPRTEEFTEAKEIEDTPYDHDIDTLTEWIHGILEDMEHGDADQWYRAQIFQLCIKQDKLNFSKLARETGIPRTSIAQAYYECIDYVKNKLHEYGHDYNFIGRIISDYTLDADEMV
jgi:hypothetical protein